jgi:selenide,water dikinase
MGPQDLGRVLEALPQIDDPRVLVGFNTADDAGVVKINDEFALIQTVDIFTPVVDDPYNYGQIAATNSISDVYAMGGKPICALNIMGFPQAQLDLSVMIEILKGAHDKAKEAGIPIVGGHTIKDKELKFGLSVTGSVHPQKIITNANARPGDRLFLTKPLGSGAISTAVRAGKLSDEEAQECIEVMKKLNRHAAEAMVLAGVNSATDITGFGFLGHAWEMANASSVGMVIYAEQVPILDKTFSCIEAGTVPGGSYSNLKFLEDKVVFDSNIDNSLKIALCDAQTSGGLFIAIPPSKVELFLAEMRKRGEAEWVTEVGEVIAGERGKIRVCKK